MATLSDEDNLSKFFGGMTAGYGNAARRLGQTQHELVVAGRKVRICFAGAALTGQMRPLAHLAADAAEHPAGDSDAEFLVWESTTTGILPPPPPWTPAQIGRRGEIVGLGSEEISASFNRQDCLVCLFDRRSRRGVFWIRDVAKLPYWDISAPFRNLFHWWSQTFGGQIAHAAAVGQGGEGVLLVGRGGQGKSTTAAACIDAGMQYVGDDYVLLTREPHPVAHSLFNCGKIRLPFQTTAMPQWNSRIAGQVGIKPKSLFYLHECLPSQMRRQLVLRGILMPEITAAPQARIESGRQSSGVLAAAPSTMSQLPGARRQAFAFFAALSRELPAYTLLLGTDLTSAPREISAWLCKEALCHAA